MADEEAPRIEFPCDYPIKIMGVAGEELHATVCTVMQRHAADFDASCITIRDSAQGNYRALTVTIRATGINQLQAIFTDLKTSPAVKMIL